MIGMTLTSPVPLGAVILSVIVTLVLIGAVSYFVSLNRTLTGRLVEYYLTIHEKMSGLNNRVIENLDVLQEEADKLNYAPLSEGVQKLREDSRSAYLGRWIPDPRSELAPEHLLKLKGIRVLNKDHAYSVLGIGIITSLILIIYLFILLPTDHTAPVIISLLPLAFGCLGFIILTITTNLYKRRLDHASRACYLEIERHIPVFNPESGTALLIENFLNYDREMKDSVDLLSNKVVELSDHALVNAVRDGIETTVRDTIAPPIQEANQAMSNLAGEYSRRQVEGLSELAAEFAHELARSVRDQMAPFYHELNRYTTDLNQSKNQMDLALDALDTYGERAIELQANVDETLKSFREAHSTWADDTTKLGKAVTELSATSEKMVAVQASHETGLATRLTTLSGDLTTFAGAVSLAVEQLAQENKDLKAMVSQVAQTNAELLTQMNETVFNLIRAISTESNDSVEKYRLLSVQMSEAAADMQKTNRQIHQTLSTLNEQLNHSVERFESGMTDTVSHTLGDFDRNLAEINGRLAASTLMVRDAVSDLSKTIEDWSVIADRLTPGERL